MGKQMKLGLDLQDEFGHIWDKIAETRGRLDRLEARARQLPTPDPEPPQRREITNIVEWSYFAGESQIAERRRELEEQRGPFSIGVKIVGEHPLNDFSTFIHVLRGKGLTFHAYDHKDRPIECRVIQDQAADSFGTRDVELEIGTETVVLRVDEPARVGFGYVRYGNQKLGITHFQPVPVNPFEE